MTRRSFFSRSLACLGAMVLAPVRAVTAETKAERIARLRREVRESPIYAIDWGETKVVTLRGHWTRG